MEIWKTIELNKDTVIEASAGTGKTYTIEHLVGRYLAESMTPGKQPLAVSQLLLVTFTEKAAGEMKERIRNHLQEIIERKPAAERDDLQTQIDNFDNAAISTIHSFCQSILREYAFENGQVFDLQLVDEKELMGGILREIMRKDWPVWVQEDFATDLDDLLMTVCPNNKATDLFELILKMATASSSCEFHVPEVDIDRLNDVKDELRRLGDGSSFAGRYRQLNFRADSKAARAEILDKVDHWLSTENLEDAAKIWECASGKGFFKDKDRSTGVVPEFGCIILSKWNKNNDNHNMVMPELYDLANVLQTYRAQFLNVYVAQRDGNSNWKPFYKKTIDELRAQLDTVKAEQGLMTYDDMLVRVRDALDPEKNPGADGLIETLRDRYTVALVDEFQDTDPVQWEIFKKVFHDSEKNVLMVVGDPKQAIYSFRGADLHTYLEAKEKITSTNDISQKTGHQHTLGNNFRSTKELLDAFNTLFKTDAWFGTDTITYAHVAYPENGKTKITQSLESLNRPPVVAVDVKENVTNGGVENMAAFAAAEIAAYVGSPEAFRVAAESAEDKATYGDDRPLKYSDFCILVRTKAKVPTYERALRDRGIPCSFYKKPGIYQSDEALHIRYMLRLLATPSSDNALKTALMTRFFPIRAIDLNILEQEADADIRPFLDRWVKFCDKREWGKLFHSLMTDTGLVFRESQHADGERRIANYRQIFEELETAASDQSLDILGLHKLVSQRVAKHVEVDEDTDRHRLETEDDTVKIMTMHASKGLQYPIVFVGTGAKSDLNHDTIFCFHENDERKISLDKEISKPRATTEMLAEQKRLFYVALTRAKYRVYLPYARIDKGKKQDPFDTLTTPAIEQAWGCPPSNLVPWDNPDGPPNTGKETTPEKSEKDPESPPVSTVDFPEIGSLYPYQRHIDSFSSLARHAATETAPTTNFSPNDDKEDDENIEEENTGNEPAPEPSEGSLLPRGIKTGNVLHDLMEALAPGYNGVGFGIVKDMTSAEELLANEDVAGLIDRTMQRHGLKNYQKVDDNGKVTATARHELAGMIRQTLTTPLSKLDQSLADIAEKGTFIPELEFHFSEGEKYLGEDPGVKDYRRGLLNGFIDLLFEVDGKLYIVDWKTNSLDDYRSETIKQAMETSDYMLQYRIYALAVLEWLRQTYGEEATDKFGGVFYLFTRGLAKGKGEGIYADLWKPEKEEACKKVVRKRLRFKNNAKADDQGEDYHE